MNSRENLKKMQDTLEKWKKDYKSSDEDGKKSDDRFAVVALRFRLSDDEHEVAVSSNIKPRSAGLAMLRICIKRLIEEAEEEEN